MPAADVNANEAKLAQQHQHRAHFEKGNYQQLRQDIGENLPDGDSQSA